MTLLRRIASFPDWAPAYRDLDDVRRELDRVFDSLGDFTGFRTAGVFPAINVFETPDAIRVRAEIPGVRREDLEVSVENDTLTVAGKREMTRESDEASFHRREREWGSFRRSFSLPVRIDGNHVQARYADGILTVELPKAAEARPKQITVSAGA